MADSVTRPKSNRGGPRFGKGPRGPRKGQAGAGRPQLSGEARSAVVVALRADGGSVSRVARLLGHGRETVRRIRDEEGIEAKSPADNSRK